MLSVLILTSLLDRSLGLQLLAGKDLEVNVHGFHPNRNLVKTFNESKEPLDGCPLEKPDTDECFYYGRMPCNKEFVQNMQRRCRKRPGLIVTGQGGSATRAAQVVIETLSTHDFGLLSNSSHDSLAARYSYLWSGDRDLLSLTTNNTYDPFEFMSKPDLSSNLTEKPFQVCRTLRLLDDMIRRKELARRPEMQVVLNQADHFEKMKPWALKSPYLRMLLPFFDALVGPAGYLLIHVTRDVHHIHELHGDENTFDLIYKHVAPKKAADFSFDYGAKKIKRGKLALSGESESAFSKVAMTQVLVEVHKAAKELYGDEENEFEKGEVKAEKEKFVMHAKFAYVWGHTELGLKRAWMAGRPDQYFHLSERRFLEHGLSSARDLAKFLGVEKPGPSVIRKMLSIYQPEAPDTEHFAMMRKITALKSMSIVREALLDFGYHQYSKDFKKEAKFIADE